MLRIAQIVANIVKSICTPSWRLSTRFHEKDELVGCCGGGAAAAASFGRSDRNFPLAGLGNLAKGASCCWPLVLAAGTAPRDDGLGMMIHFAAPLFLGFTSHAVSSYSLCLLVSLTHSLFRNFFPAKQPNFSSFFFLLLFCSGSLDTDFFFY